jgi:hypothetical protein
VKERITIEKALQHRFFSGLPDTGYDVCPMAMVSIKHVDEVFGCPAENIELNDIKPGSNRSEIQLGLSATLRQIRSDMPPKEVRAIALGDERPVTNKLCVARGNPTAASSGVLRMMHPKSVPYRRNERDAGSSRKPGSVQRNKRASCA